MCYIVFRYVKPSHGADCLSRESGQPNYVLTLVLAQLLIGIGGSPLYTLGTAYIDNHVDKRKAPSYIGTATGWIGLFTGTLSFDTSININNVVVIIIYNSVIRSLLLLLVCVSFTIIGEPTDSRSLRVIETGTIWKPGYGFPFAFHSNYGLIL